MLEDESFKYEIKIEISQKILRMKRVLYEMTGFLK